MVGRTAAVILVEGGPNDGQMIPLSRGSNVMGREMANRIVDTETGVSRRHAEIVETDASYFLRDLTSTNGTSVNGRTIDEAGHDLSDGDRIQLGPSKVAFIFKSDRAMTAQFTVPTQD